jgi:uncharacterized RDD family membrane protein YckC
VARERATAPRPIIEAARLAAAAASRAARGALEDEEEGEDEDEETSDERDDASLHERLLAFGIDCAVVVGLLLLAKSIAPEDLLERAKEDPSGRIAFALGAWCSVAVIAWFAIVEAVFGRTPGKRVLGLEVRDAETGERPAPLSLVYRNLFRIEVVFATTVIPLLSFAVWVPLLSLAVMLATPRTQRPGDLIAGTVVLREKRRPRHLPRADHDEDEDEEEEP